MNRLAACSLLSVAILAASRQSSLGAQYRVTLLQPPGVVEFQLGGGYTFGSNIVLGVSGGTVVGDGPLAFNQLPHALLWDGVSARVTDLHPEGFERSGASDIFGATQVGYGFSIKGWAYHALKWSGTAESVVDLHPPGYVYSFARAVTDAYQIGVGGQLAPDRITQTSHALLWNDSAASVVDLHPARFTSTDGMDVAEGVQVGFGHGPHTRGSDHALLWRGTAESVVDLHPVLFGAAYTQALATDGVSQVGIAGRTLPHAMLWKGTAISAKDLHPRAYSSSVALNVQDNLQVGYARLPETLPRAMLWHGTAESAVDLHDPVAALLGEVSGSVAHGFDGAGNIIGMASSGTTGEEYIAKWSLIPEPASRAMMMVGFAAFLIWSPLRQKRVWHDATHPFRRPNRGS
jgi:hypothetical protein